MVFFYHLTWYHAGSIGQIYNMQFIWLHPIIAFKKKVVRLQNTKHLEMAEIKQKENSVCLYW